MRRSSIVKLGPSDPSVWRWHFLWRVSFTLQLPHTALIRNRNRTHGSWFPAGRGASSSESDKCCTVGLRCQNFQGISGGTFGLSPILSWFQHVSTCLTRWTFWTEAWVRAAGDSQAECGRCFGELQPALLDLRGGATPTLKTFHNQNVIQILISCTCYAQHIEGTRPFRVLLSVNKYAAQLVQCEWCRHSTETAALATEANMQLHSPVPLRHLPWGFDSALRETWFCHLWQRKQRSTRAKAGKNYQHRSTNGFEQQLAAKSHGCVLPNISLVEGARHDSMPEIRHSA